MIIYNRDVLIKKKFQLLSMLNKKVVDKYWLQDVSQTPILVLNTHIF